MNIVTVFSRALKSVNITYKYMQEKCLRKSWLHGFEFYSAVSAREEDKSFKEFFRAHNALEWVMRWNSASYLQVCLNARTYKYSEDSI